MQLAEHVAARFARLGLAGTTGVVAVSGGPDSVALAHLLIELQRAGKFDRLILAHVNHQLRGAESDADECFVQSLPALWQTNAACRTCRIDVAALAAADHENLEAVARRERYRWLTQVAQEQQAAWIATGHTADDQAETVLFRLLRGSGVLGLSAIPECRPLEERLALVRPLLSVLRRQNLRAYLDRNQLPFRLDSSNRDLSFTRNRLRLELLPVLEHAYNPAVVEVLCRLADQASELQADVAAQAAQLQAAAELPRAGTMLVFSTDRLRGASANQVREMFRFIWMRENWPMADMDSRTWNRLVEIATGNLTAWDFPGPIHARRERSVMQLERG